MESLNIIPGAGGMGSNRGVMPIKVFVVLLNIDLRLVAVVAVERLT